MPCELFSSRGEQQLLSRSGAQASPCSGFLVLEHTLWGTQASAAVACGARSYSSQAPEHRLNSCGLQASSLLHSMWHLPRPGIKSVSPELAGRFFLPLSDQEALPVLEGLLQGRGVAGTGPLAAAGLGSAHWLTCKI